MEPKQQPPYPLRMSQELRNQLEKEAVVGRRSLNAEIVDRLEMSVAGQRPDTLLLKTLSLAMARTEQSAAMTRLRAQADLLSTMRISKALLDLVSRITEIDPKLIGNDSSLEVALSLAHRFRSEAKGLVNAENVDINIRHAEIRERELREAEKGILDAVAELKVDVPPERVISYKGPSGKARAVNISTRSTRKMPD